MSLPKPPYDAELGQALAQLPIVDALSREMIPSIRANLEKVNTANLILAACPGISHEERTIQGSECELVISIFRRKDSEGNASRASKPGIYYIHGGGMIFGNRFLGISVVAEWIITFDAVCISIEYRQAPEHPDPAPIEDCYAGLAWVGDNLKHLEIHPEKLMIAGQSAGGGLAAGLALLVRDRGGPRLCAQLLMCPMLDDRNRTISCQQFKQGGAWSGTTNAMAWSCYIPGEGTPTPYAAPGRAKDLSGLPPAFIDVGSAETFRDEDVAYALQLWASGVQAELHVWPGSFHGSDYLVPSAVLSKVATTTRISWIERLLSSL